MTLAKRLSEEVQQIEVTRSSLKDPLSYQPKYHLCNQLSHQLSSSLVYDQIWHQIWDPLYDQLWDQFGIILEVGLKGEVPGL